VQHLTSSASYSWPLDAAASLSPALKAPSTTATKHTTPLYSSWNASNSSRRIGWLGEPVGGGMRLQQQTAAC
jgi:hypothetical protein